MKGREEEEKLLHSTALQNVKSILQARERAEDELVRTKEALEGQARELARSVSTLRATLEATIDALLVTGPAGEFVDCNDKFTQLWGLSREQVAADDEASWRAIARRVGDEPGFLARLAQIQGSTSETFDQLDLGDGRVVERFSTVQIVDDAVAGRVWSFRDVTERKLHEAALRSSRAQFSAIIQHSPVGILLLDARLRVIQGNPSARPLFGEVEAYVGRELSELLSRLWVESAASDILEQIRQTLTSGEPCARGRLSGLRRDRGVREDYEWQLHRLTLPDGQHGVVCYFVEISAHVRALEALRESAQRLQLALAAGRLGDWSWDAASDVLSFGARAAELFDLTADTKIARAALRERVHADDRERASSAFERAVGERSDYEAEYRVQRKRGDEVWISAQGRAVQAADGSLVGMIGVVQDVTDRKRLEIVLQRLAAVVESSDDAIVTKDLQGTVLTWNTGAERIFGYTAAEMIGSSILRVIPTELHAEEERILARQRRGERVDHYETVRVTKTGRRIDVSLTVSPIRDATGTIIGASKVARDITARKHAQAELQSAAEERQLLLEAERSARVEVERVSFMKDEFLATLSHELRTPLNAIVGWSQVLRMRGNADAEVLEGLDVIERNAKAQAQLIEDLLDVSRIISGKVRLDVQRVDVQEVVKGALASVRHSADSKGLRLHAVIDPLVGPVWGDPGRLQQCFWNLLTNAIKFTQKGGKVQVSLARVASHLEFTVVDDGQGISPEFLPHVFERFRQADASTTRRHGGLGLGLSIVKQLIELHGGSVRAESAGVGRGSTFRLELPVMIVGEAVFGRGRASTSTAPLALKPDLPSLQGISVLAVDDEADARTLIKRVLEDCGARVFVAESARQGLEILRREKPDILISDIGMPDEDGYEFIRAVRRLPPERGGRIPAAALSAFARAEDRTRALRAGYQTHLAKPVEPMELTAVVASLVMRQ